MQSGTVHLISDEIENILKYKLVDNLKIQMKKKIIYLD